jgi:hypothetical protein
LPWLQSIDSYNRRQNLFKKFDSKEKGYLKISDVDRGIKGAIKLPILFPLRRVVMRAFSVVKQLSKAHAGQSQEEMINEADFRLILKFISHYFEYWIIV